MVLRIENLHGIKRPSCKRGVPTVGTSKGIHPGIQLLAALSA
jgi:hypothetical protein